MEDKIKLYIKIQAVLKKRTILCNSGKKNIFSARFLLATLELGIENIFHLLIKRF